MKLKSRLNKMGFWSIKPILSTGCDILMVFGERSNGKTYGVLEEICKEYAKTGRPSLLIRRFAESLKMKNLNKLFDSHIENGILKTLKCDKIQYYSGSWYCCDLLENGKYRRHDKPFLYTLALNAQEISKGTFSDVHLAYVLFDEFLTREYYLRNEFITFMNALSTTIRNTPDTKVFMVANTVNWSCPYFREMGLTNIDKMTQGTIDIYEYKDELNGSVLRLAVEYCSSSKQTNKKESNKWYAFDSPSLKMITNGKWEMESYPHPNFEKNPKTICRDFYIQFENEKICLELLKDDVFGLFILARPYLIDFDERAKRIYTDKVVLDSRYRTSISTTDSIDKIIWGLFKRRKFLYSDNTVGENVRNFLSYLNINNKKY